MKDKKEIKEIDWVKCDSCKMRFSELQIKSSIINTGRKGKGFICLNCGAEDGFWIVRFVDEK